jgi:hypothetical protein
MSDLSTAARVSANQYLREARRLEALHANHMAPGTATWCDALKQLFKRIDRVGSPLKQVKILQSVTAYLDGVADKEAIHIGILNRAPTKRSASLVFMTFSADEHPFLGVKENGLVVSRRALLVSRCGIYIQAERALAYASWHAVARLYDRGYRLTAGCVFTIFGFFGALGLLVGSSEKHVNSKVCLRFNDVLAVGVVRHAITINPYKDEPCVMGFLDVRTILTVDQLYPDQQPMLEQGEIAYEATREWLRTRDIKQVPTLAERIPFLPRDKDDFVLRTATYVEVPDGLRSEICAS